jgi:hypothetical protein
MISNKSIKNGILFFIAFAFIIMGSCKKYPDGPLVSLYSKEHRVVGTWDVEYFSINGIDSTEYLKSNTLNGYYIFSKEKEGFAELTYSNYNHFYGIGAHWNFANHKKNIEIKTEYVVPDTIHFNLGLFDQTTPVSWRIMRLTEEQMWLKGIYTDGREYFFKLKPKQ